MNINIDTPSITGQIVNVTPELAVELLGRNKRNRQLSNVTVARYAAAMTKGDWRMAGDPIRFSEAGDLIDGQHRLHAIVVSGITQAMVIVCGLDADVQNVLDTGRKRTLGDMLKMRGEMNAKNLAASIRTHYVFRTYGTFHSSGSFSMTIDDGLRHLDRHEGLRDATRHASRVRRLLRMSGGVLAALLYEFDLVDTVDAHGFIERLEGGANLGSDDPILKLREYLINRPRSMVIKNEHFAALTIKTWNAYRTGQKVRQLSYRAGGANPEEFPRIDGAA